MTKAEIWLYTLDRLHPFTGISQYLCDRCNIGLTYSLYYVDDIAKYNDEWTKTVERHYKGECKDYDG